MEKSTKVKIGIGVFVGVLIVALIGYVWVTTSAKVDAAEKKLGVMLQDIWNKTSELGEKVQSLSDNVRLPYSVYNEEMEKQAALEARKNRKAKKGVKVAEKGVEPAYVGVFENWVKAEGRVLSFAEKQAQSAPFKVDSHVSFDKLFYALKNYEDALARLARKIPSPQQITIVHEKLFAPEFEKLKASIEGYNSLRGSLGFADNWIDLKTYPKAYPPIIITKEEPVKKE